MENEVLYDSLEFDNKIIAEKLGIYDYEAPTMNGDINSTLKLAMMKKELEKNKAMLLKNNALLSSMQEKTHLNTIPKHPEPEKRFVAALDNNQVIMLIIFVAVVICVVQYLSYASSMSEMMQIINNFVRSVPIASNVSLSQANQSNQPNQPNQPN